MSTEYTFRRADQHGDVPECDRCGAEGDETPLGDFSESTECELCASTVSTDHTQQRINKALNIAVKQIRNLLEGGR